MPENQETPQNSNVSDDKEATEVTREGQATSPIKKATAIVAPAALAVPADIAANNVLNSAETGHEGDIHFEPGIHPIFDFQNDALYSGYDSGENVHVWNTEVGERISQYKPDSLTIDGVSPFLISHESRNSEEYKNTIDVHKGYIWRSLPDRVLRLNPYGSIFVIAGDIEDPTIRYFLNGKLNSPYDGYNKQYSEDIPMTGLPQLAEGYPKYVLAYLIGTKILEELNIVNKTPFTRRKFLSLVSKAAGLAATASLANKFFPSISPDYNLDKILRAVNQSSTHFFQDNGTQIVDGRSALLIEKEIDANKYLKSLDLIPDDAQGSVVMGADHDKHSFEYLNNSGSRQQAISRLAEIMVQITRRAAEELGLTQDQTNGAINSTLDSLSAIQIWRATDSGEDFPIPDIRAYVSKNIELAFPDVKSDGIEKAISHLRPN